MRVEIGLGVEVTRRPLTGGNSSHSTEAGSIAGFMTEKIREKK